MTIIDQLDEVINLVNTRLEDAIDLVDGPSERYLHYYHLSELLSEAYDILLGIEMLKDD
jgi:hypothetical protein